MDRWIMHVDMDAFYASVEQYRNYPELQGRPVCVGHDPKQGNGRGVVRAASYEARAYGIRAGMPVSTAYQICPDAVFVSGRFSDYGEASDEVMAILAEYADEGRIRRASIDEAYIEVTFKVMEYSSPIELAKEIQSTIKKRTKLPSSIGIAPNMTVAKVATGMNKPMGITFVDQTIAAAEKFLGPLPVSALNGVGSKTASHLREHGIETLGQIQKMTVTELWPIMGRASSWLLRRAKGIDERPLVDNGPRVRKSISHDRTFMEDVDPEATDYLHDTINKMCDSIAKKLKTKDLRFRTVTVKIRYKDYSTIQRGKSIPVSTNDPEILKRLAIDLFEQKRDHDKPLRLVGVKASGLEEQRTLSLTEFIN